MKYDNPWKHYLNKYLRNTDYFRSLNIYNFEKLIYNCKREQYDQGSIIFKEGTESKGMWIIISGAVCLEIRIGSLDVPLTVLGPGFLINYHKMAYIPSFNKITARSQEFTTLAFLSN